MAHTSPGMNSSPSNCQNEMSWQEKYTRCRNNLQAVKSQMRVQSAKSRQLISAVTNQLQTKDLEIQKIRKIHDQELNTICQQLLFLHGCLIRERDRITSIVQEKDRTIQMHLVEISRLKQTSLPSSIVAVTSVRPSHGSSSSVRQHESFRQYKKEKLTRQHRFYNSSSESNLSGGWTGSSEESSESSPRQGRQPLRLTLSSGSVETNVPRIPQVQKQSFELIRPRKGILKISSSYGNPSSENSQSSSPDLNVLEKLHNLLKTKDDFSPSIVKNLLVGTTDTEKIIPLSTSKNLVKKEDRSDSGRDSEDQSSLEPSFSSLYSISSSSSSSSSGVITDSPNSSFDAADPTTKVVIEIRKSKPPAPPPRSITTRLSSSPVGVSKPLVISPSAGLQTRVITTSNSTTITNITTDEAPTISVRRRGSAGDALDCLIYEPDGKHPPATQLSAHPKKVKFSPKVDCKSVHLPNSFKPLDPNFLLSVQKLGSEKVTKTSGITYFEPYL